MPPKDAGTYTASVTVGGATASVEFTLLNYAAKVTDKDGNAVGTYKTFEDAITAAEGSEGSTITLLDDITLTKEQNIRSGKFTLDLNGKNLINENGRVLYILEEADLTIKDSGEGGTVETKRLSVDCIYNSGKLTVESGIIKGDGGIRNFGVLYFNDGTVEADNYPAIANYNDSTVYVYDGVLKGGKNSGAVENGGTLYVYGGEIESIVNVNDAYISGGKIDRDDYVALNLLGGTVEITGGSFTGTDNEYGRHSGTPYGEWTVDIDEGATLILKGGEFPNGFVFDETTANAFLAEDYYYKDADGKLIDVADDAKIINGYVKVSKGADLSEAVITVDKTEFVYNGQHQAPAVTVTIGGKTLTENVDYVVNARRWENGVPVQWFYYVDAGVYTSVIDGLGDYTGKVEKVFVIKPATVDVIWEGDVFYYTGNPHKVTAKYVDIDGNESNEFELINYVNTDVGVYTATAIFADSNYSATEAAINHTYEIKWYDGAPDATVSGTKGENGWYTSAVTVTAPEGYTISTAVDGAYGNTITFVENEENAVYYLKQTENGYIAKVELGEIKCDLADPAAEITMAENKWNSFFNTVTFGYFFKETQSITITASDETSGIAKIEYVVATEEITDFENAEWIEYTEKFNIEPNSKNIIYAKATDKAGRYVIVNTDGIVLYTDSQAVTSEATYILTSMEDVEFEIDFNGNEVAYIMHGGSYLVDPQYTATENGIKLHASYIENAYTAGEYQFTVYVDPLGENFGYEGIGYDKYIEPHGDTPETITLTLTVKKLDGNVEITNDISKTYDGKAVSAPEYDIIGTGDVTVEYKVKGADDSTYTTEAPVNAGEYTVRVSVAETGKSTAASATKDFTIAKKAVTVTATAPDKVYDGTTDILEYSKVIVEFDGAVEGEMLGFTVGKAWYDTADAGTDKTVHIIYAPVASNNIDNYEFPINPEYSTDNCYVEAKADISKKAVTATATASDKQYNGVNDIDKSKITVILDGIVGGESVETTVETAWIEGKSVGDNYLVPVFFSVSGDAAKNYIFPINELYPTEFYYAEATVNIYNDFTPKKGTEYTVNSNDWINNDFVVTANKGYQLSLSNEVNGWSDTLSKSEETENGSITFYVKNKETGAISLAVTENYKIDKTKPHGYFSDSHGRGYEYLLLDEIQTEPYYENEDIFTHKYEAWDDASGIANMEYYFSITKLSKAELDSVSGWTEFELDIDIEDIFEFPGDETYSYIRVMDKAGNTIYYVAHLVYDGEMAKINGVLDGFTYYTTQIISVTDNFKLDYVTVNGEVIKSGYDTITLEGNCNATYEIFAYDLAGNPRDEAIITMKPIATLSEPVDNLKEETLKSSDKETIEAVKAKVEKIDTTDATEEEKAELQKILDKCDALLKIIADTQAEIDELGKNVDSYKEDSVKSSDSEDLTQLKEDIQNLIDSDNTTENEKTALEDMIKDIEGLEDKIAETEQQLEDIKDIENGYNPETVTSDDKAAIEDKIAEIEAVNPDNLTEEQREEYEEIKAGFEALLAEIAAAEKDVADIGAELETFEEERVTKFWEDDIEALKAKINELLADENMGETEKAKLNEYKAQCDKLIEIINTPVEYFSLRFFYLIWDCLIWKYNGILWLFSKIFGLELNNAIA